MRQRFTLVELMIVIAIIQVLAAIAIPSLHDLQMRARKAEVPLIVEGIRDAAWGAYTDAVFDPMLGGSQAWSPNGSPGRGARPWTAVSGTNLDLIDYSADGHVRGSYAVGGGSLRTITCEEGSPAVGFLSPADVGARGKTDLDEDTVEWCYGDAMAAIVVAPVTVH